MRSAAALLIALVLRPAVGAGLAFPVTACSGSYFDVSSLACASCLVPGVPLRQPTNGSLNLYGSPRGCTCAMGSAVVPRVCDPASNQPCASDTCSVCPANQTSSRDGSHCLPCGGGAAYAGAGLDCVCPAGQALVERSAQGVLYAAKACTPCPARGRLFLTPQGIFPGDAYACAACADPHAYVTAAGTCACDSGYTPTGLGGALGARGSAGAAAVECVPAAAASLVNTNYPKATLQTFNDLGQSTTSLVFYALFTSAAVGCKGFAAGDAASARQCQALANLCALTFANPNHDTCKLLAALGSARGPSAARTAIPGWYAGFPLITWGATTATLAGDAASLPAQMVYYYPNAALNTFSALRFFLARFSLNGTFLGLQRLRNQLSYCRASADASEASPLPPWYAFGYGFTEVGVCDLASLLSAGAVGSDPATGAPALNLKEPVFYDLYVQDLSTDGGPSAGGKGPDAVPGSANSLLNSVISSALASGVLDPTRLPITLVPVPVRITNYIGASGAQPNINTWSANEADDVYTGRFTLFDGASGASATDGLPPVYLRYASAITLTIYASVGAASTSIAPPVLTITYTEKRLTDVLASPKAPFVLAVEYTRLSYAAYLSTLTGLGVFLLMCTALWAAGTTVAHLRMNARTALEGALTAPVALQWLAFLVSGYAVVSYWFILIFSLYWLVFFKLQVRTCAPFASSHLRCAFPPCRLTLSLPSPHLPPPPHHLPWLARIRTPPFPSCPSAALRTLTTPTLSSMAL